MLPPCNNVVPGSHPRKGLASKPGVTGAFGLKLEKPPLSSTSRSSLPTSLSPGPRIGLSLPINDGEIVGWKHKRELAADSGSMCLKPSRPRSTA